MGRCVRCITNHRRCPLQLPLRRIFGKTVGSGGWEMTRRDGSCPADEASSRFGAFKRSRALLARRTQVIGEELSRRPSSRLPASWRCRPGTA